MSARPANPLAEQASQKLYKTILRMEAHTEDFFALVNKRSNGKRFAGFPFEEIS